MTKDCPVDLPTRSPDSHKGDFGRTLLVGGSRGMAGSIALSAIAALKTGSGLVSACIPDRCLETVAGFHCGIMTIPCSNDQQGRFAIPAAAEIRKHAAKVDAVGCGPGMTTEPGSFGIVEAILSSDVPRVLDADAINTMAIMQWPDDVMHCRDAALVLTPHPGEFARLSGVSAGDREGQISAAIDLSMKTGATIVLKGGQSVVTGAAAQQWIGTTGNPGMATAGSGDVLTGVITSLLGQGLSAWDAARLGVWIHGWAGTLAANQIGQAGMTCEDILNALPEAVSLAQSNA